MMVFGRIDRERAQGVDLLGDFHRGQFRRHGGTDPARDHEGAQDGAELAAHGQGHDRPDAGTEAEILELKLGLGGKDRADKTAGDDDDGNRLGTDEIDLADEREPGGCGNETGNGRCPGRERRSVPATWNGMRMKPGRRVRCA